MGFQIGIERAPCQRNEHELAAMRRALALAETARGRTSPNPAVGAVIIDADGDLVGEGATQPAGGPHAEIIALGHAGDRARGATAVVTLEPCAHVGRTGPCADALVEAGIARVVYALDDPNVVAAGGGTRLQVAGVEVEAGVLADEAAKGAIRPWLHAISTGRPFVTWKVASTLDGRVAASDNTSRWISSAISRADAHLVRAGVDAIMVGSGTVLADDPQLTARTPDGDLADHQPLAGGARPPAPRAAARPGARQRRRDARTRHRRAPLRDEGACTTGVFAICCSKAARPWPARSSRPTASTR